MYSTEWLSEAFQVSLEEQDIKQTIYLEEELSLPIRGGGDNSRDCKRL